MYSGMMGPVAMIAMDALATWGIKLRRPGRRGWRAELVALLVVLMVLDKFVGVFQSEQTVILSLHFQGLFADPKNAGRHHDAGAWQPLCMCYYTPTAIAPSPRSPRFRATRPPQRCGKSQFSSDGVL